MATNTSNLELVLVGWVDARRRHDLETIARHLHPDVVWHGLRKDLVCSDRDAVLQNIRGSLRRRLPDVEGIELCAAGDQVLFGVRSPDFTEMGGEPLDGEIYSVFTIRDGLIAQIEAFKTRDAATRSMQAHRRTPEGPAEPASGTPPP